MGPPADLYAVGATLFAMVTGRHPSVLAALQRRPELLENVDPAIAHVIRKATEWDVADRYPDGRAMAVDIAAAVDSLSDEQSGATWMAGLDSALETSLARRGRKPPGPTPFPPSPRSLAPVTPTRPNDRTQPGRARPVEQTTLPAGVPQRASMASLLLAFFLGIGVMGLVAAAIYVTFYPPG